MNYKRLYLLSLLLLLIAAGLFAADYYLFHYVTPEGFTLIKQTQPGKPFLTNLLGVLATDLLSASIFTGLFAAVMGKGNREE